jgi:hypothetical protein
MRLPTAITSNGAPGLVKPITVWFPASIRIRCWFHRLAHLRKPRQAYHDEASSGLRMVRCMDNSAFCWMFDADVGGHCPVAFLGGGIEVTTGGRWPHRAVHRAALRGVTAYRRSR